MNGNALEVRFDNINLPDSASDPAGSQGYFSYVVVHEGVLPPLTEITNTAAIYFDFNAPIITNTVVNTVAEPSSVIPGQLSADVRVYPNPSKGIFNVQLKERELESISVYDLTGRMVLQTQELNLNLSGETSGVYLLKIATNKGVTTQRIVLEK